MFYLDGHNFFQYLTLVKTMINAHISSLIGKMFIKPDELRYLKEQSLVSKEITRIKVLAFNDAKHFFVNGYCNMT